MKRIETITRRLAIALLMAAGASIVIPASAITLTTSAASPGVDPLDIANLNLSTGGNLIWTDRPVVGQTFSSGPTWAELNSITIQIGGPTTIVGWKDYLFRMSTVESGVVPTLNVLMSETVRQDSDVIGDTYFTFTFDTPVLMPPNTTYAFDVGVSGSQAGWQAGIPSVRATGGVFDEGQSYSAGRPNNPGTDLSLQNNDLLFHADVSDVPGSGFLTLEVDTTSGAMKVIGGAFVDIELNYYQVTSTAGSLDPLGWNSLADQDLDGNGPPNGSGNGWEEAGGSNAHSFGEGYLLGSTTIVVDGELAMGNGYDTAMDARDLAFTYRTGAGEIYEGLISYVSSLLPGDTDGDGDIDDADLGTAFSNYTGPVGAAGNKTAAQGDTDNDGDVDDADLGTSFAGYTGPLGPSSVPEPTTLGLLGVMGLVCQRRRGLRA